jgi:hypothetical protein
VPGLIGLQSLEKCQPKLSCAEQSSLLTIKKGFAFGFAHSKLHVLLRTEHFLTWLFLSLYLPGFLRAFFEATRLMNWKMQLSWFSSLRRLGLMFALAAVQLCPSHIKLEKQ